MIETTFHNRRAVQIENETIRIIITRQGGHIAGILDKASGVNPLWIPPWPSIEPTTWQSAEPTWGEGAEARLLSGILGHSLCLDMFGPPSADEEAAGMVVHGEAGVVPWDFDNAAYGLTARCTLPVAQLGFERTIRLEGRRVLMAETVENLSPLDRPIAWTQHVTLGPPFLECGVTQFRASATRSLAMGEGSEFDWPLQPRGAGLEDLRVFTRAERSGGYTAHLLDPKLEQGWFWAWSPASRLLAGYVWNRADFPWLGIWEENHSRSQIPWNGVTVTRGMEFGVSPFPETRRQMIDRGETFGTPGLRWIGGRKRITVDYYAAVAAAGSVPETLSEFEESVR